MSSLLYSVAGLLIFTAAMVVLRKKQAPLYSYIMVCLAASSSGAILVMAVYGHFFGVFNLYFYIVTALIIGLILDFLVQKIVPLKK